MLQIYNLLFFCVLKQLGQGKTKKQLLHIYKIGYTGLQFA